MTERVLEPGSCLGVLGGGQLGAMFAEAARRMGYSVAVWDPDPDAPAHRLASRSFPTPFVDPVTREAFANIVGAVTFEWENVPADLCAWLERDHRVRPSSAVLGVIQDRIVQKQFLQSRGLPVPQFRPLPSSDQLTQTVTTLGLPVICKTAMAGYDGKGQWTIRNHSDAGQVEHMLRQASPAGVRWIVETLVSFERELSVLVVRAQDGACRTYPVVDNWHQQGILRLSVVPAPVAPTIAKQAKDLASQAVAALNGVGVFCVELFQGADGNLLINEIAPRPHNSAHYTLDACSVSQFEQQVRILCSLPVGEARLLSPAAMVNVIGEELRQVTTGPGFRDLLAMPGAVLHVYGKLTPRARRKMGHITFLAESAELAADHAAQFINRLA